LYFRQRRQNAIQQFYLFLTKRTVCDLKFQQYPPLIALPMILIPSKRISLYLTLLKLSQLAEQVN
jgi:hypothetical protein